MTSPLHRPLHLHRPPPLHAASSAASVPLPDTVYVLVGRDVYNCKVFHLGLVPLFGFGSYMRTQ